MTLFLDREHSGFDPQFPLRAYIRYYSGDESRLTSEDISEAYTSLKSTDFCSLFAAENLYDDFAETYAMYVHVVLQKKPWELRAMNNGTLKLMIKAPILGDRLKEKRQFMDAFFQATASH